MKNSAKIPMEIRPLDFYHPKYTLNKDQRYNRQKSMSFPLPDGHLQAKYVAPQCFYYTYGSQQCFSPYHLSEYQQPYLQYQQPYPQSSLGSSRQFPPLFYPRVSPYEQPCNYPFYTPPLGYFIHPERMGHGERLSTPKRLVQPPDGIVKEGQFFFSNKIYVQLSLEQQIRLGAVNPGTQNKCRKIRPWLVLWKLENGNVIVVCSTTRENKVWDGLPAKDLRSFLPISPTPEQAGRRALQLQSDVEKVFVGRSLLFLEIEKEVHPKFLGAYIGEITLESLQRLKSERQEWKLSSTSMHHNCRSTYVNTQAYVPHNWDFGANSHYTNDYSIRWPPKSGSAKVMETRT